MAVCYVVYTVLYMSCGFIRLRKPAYYYFSVTGFICVPDF